MQFLRSSIQTLGSVGARALVSLMVQKVIAVRFGPAGITLFAHFQNLISLFIAIPNDGINRGFVRNIASENPPGSEAISFNPWFQAGLIWNAIAWVVTTLIMLVFQQAFLTDFTNTMPLAIWALVFFSSQALYLIHLFLLSFMLARLQIKLHRWFHVGTSLLQLVAVMAGAQTGQLDLALLGIVLGQGFAAFASMAWALKTGLFKELSACLSPKIKLAFSSLGEFVLMALAVAAFGRIVDFFVRNYAIKHFSLIQTGLWQAVVKLSDSYMTPVTAIIGMAFFPTVSALMHKPIELRKYLRETLGLVIPISAICLLLVYLLRTEILVFFNDSRFASAANLCQWQLWGDFFKITSYFLANLMLMEARLRLKFLMEGMSAVVYVLAIYLLLPHFQIQAFTLAHLIRFVVYCGVLGGIYRRKIW